MDHNPLLQVSKQRFATVPTKEGSYLPTYYESNALRDLRLFSRNN